MQVSVIAGRNLTDGHVGAWSDIQSANSELESPFFRPEFTMAVSQATEGVYVGILHDSAGKPSGFFPFQVVRPGFGRNLDMCDHQGVIAPPSSEFDAEELIRRCGLKVWEFDHLATANHAFRKFHFHTTESPVIDVSDGFNAYKASLDSDGRRHLAKAATSARKVEREIGPLVLVESSTDAQVMQSMHQWRAQKYGPLPDWAHNALESMRTINTPGFAGVLSALYAGDQMIAVHFGIRSRGVLHWWFPAYNQELRNYAPGILLLLNMVERCPALGITKIDLGKGLQDYKRRFRNASGTVASGSVDFPCLSNFPRILHRSSLGYIRASPGLLNLARRARLVFGRSR